MHGGVGVGARGTGGGALRIMEEHGVSMEELEHVGVMSHPAVS